MSPIFDWFFSQYEGVPTLYILLEIIAVIFGFLSTLFAKRENIWVYPTGIVSTVIYVYLLWQGKLLGDMLINAYYTTMSIYGWYLWTRKVDENHYIPITKATQKEWFWSGIVFCITLGFIALVYTYFDYWGQPSAYVDSFTTAIFFVGMWFMAKKKLENWLFWIIGDIISVPLYLYKGYVFSSFQFFIFTLIAIAAYFQWKKDLNKKPQTLLK